MKILFKILKWAIIVALMLIISVLIFGSISQYKYDNGVEGQFERTGKMADLSDCQLHYKFIGEGDFTIVLEAGLGETMSTWKYVEDSLAQIGRVLMYDRAGLGYSTFGSEPRTTKQIAQELHDLLTTENIPGPYVLVGHSIGGAHVRYYAHLFPDEIKGLFLIDPSHEKMKDDVPPPSIMQRLFLFSAEYLSWSGLPFFLLPEPPHPTYKTSKSIKAYAKEMKAIDLSIEQFKSSQMNLSHLPIYVLSASAADSPFKEKNLALQKELVDKSKSSIKKHFIFDKPHHIHVTDPQIVIDHFAEFTNLILNAPTRDSTMYFLSN